MNMAVVSFDLMTLLDVPGIGPGRVRKLLKRWDESATERPLMDGHFLREALTQPQIDALPASWERTKSQWEELQKHGVQIISIFDSSYPVILRQTLGEMAPLLLLCLGNIGLLSRTSVGFCGSREAREKGITVAYDSAALLARSRINIVPGFAAGVDMHAHRSALVTGGTTTVVLAEGIFRFRVKKEIRDVWDETRTLVVSEFGANLPWSVSNAMQRNKTICGLSRAIVVIEARKTGGSIQAGRDCLKLGLPLFAAVYEGATESANGNEELLQHGAQRLMKSRSTSLPNILPILDSIGAEPVSSAPPLRAAAS
jgi:DNA processing protein